MVVHEGFDTTPESSDVIIVCAQESLRIVQRWQSSIACIDMNSRLVVLRVFIDHHERGKFYYCVSRIDSANSRNKFVYATSAVNNVRS